MNQSPAIDKCRAYLVSQEPHRHSLPVHGAPVCITLSRQAGAGAETVAHLLEKLLNEADPGPVAWTVFDKTLIEKVLEDSELPQHLARYVREDRDLSVEALVGEALGLHPNLWTLFHHTTETILKLGRLGRCIIVGRGGNIITARLPNALHIRLVAPEAFRVAHLQDYLKLHRSDAESYLHKTDAARRRYVKTHFDRDVEDPLLSHLTINTGAVGFAEAASVIAHLALRRPKGS